MMNAINLVTREEVDELGGRVISDNEWNNFCDDIHSDDNLWQTIDFAIYKVSREVIL